MNRITGIILEEARERYFAYVRQILILEADGHPIQDFPDDPIFYAGLSFEQAKIGVCGDCLVRE